MISYTITFRFRDKDRSAQVHQYESFYLVYFTDAEIINDFGGSMELDKEKKPVKQYAIADSPTILKTLQSLLH